MRKTWADFEHVSLQQVSSFLLFLVPFQNLLSHCFSTPKKIHQGSNTCTRKRVQGWMWFTSVTLFGCWKCCFSQSREQFYYKRSCVTVSSRILRLEQSDDVLLCQDQTGACSQRDYLNKKDEWTCQGQMEVPPYPSHPYTSLTLIHLFLRLHWGAGKPA